MSETRIDPSRRKEIGQALQRLRLWLGFRSANDLAQRIGVPRWTVAGWEQGVGPLRAEDLPVLAEGLEVPLQYLLTYLGYDLGVPRDEMEKWLFDAGHRRARGTATNGHSAVPTSSRQEGVGGQRIGLRPSRALAGAAGAA